MSFIRNFKKKKMKKKIKNKFLNSNYTIFSLSVIISLLVYIITLSRTVNFIDSGELIICGYLYGIPHPTGYPLYVNLIRFFQILSPLTPVLTANLFSAFVSSLSAGFIALTVKRKFGFFPSLIAAVFFAFHLITWNISTETEVYSLSALLISVLLYLASEREDKKKYLLIFYISGLALTNHLFVIGAVIPIFLISIIKFRKNKSKLIILPFLLFFAGLSLYFFLYIRSAQSPVMDWGGVSRGYKYLYWHITGRQYQVWMFSEGFSQIFNNFKILLFLLFKNLYFPILVFSIAGFIYLFKKSKIVFSIMILTCILNLLYSSLYKIPDIDSYLLPTVIVFSIMTGFGIGYLSKKISFKYLPAIASLILIFPFIYYFPQFNKKNTYLAYDYAKSILDFLPDSSVYIDNVPGSIAWDEVSPIMYLQLIEKYRDDVIVIDKELLRRSWYVKKINRTYPELAVFWAEDLAVYLRQLESWENGENLDVILLQSSFEKLLESLVKFGSTKGGSFISRPSSDFYTNMPDYDMLFLQDHPLKPYGFFFSLDIEQDDSNIWRNISFRTGSESFYRSNERYLMNINYIKQSIWRKIYYISENNEGRITEDILPYLNLILSLDREDSLANDLKMRLF